MVAGAAVVAAAALGALSGGSSAAVPQHANGQIYFEEGGGEGGTWTEAIEPDGSARRQVFGPDGYHEQIAWSPDGGRIAFVGIAQNPQSSSDGQVRFGIYTANPDGSGSQLLTED